MIVRAEDAKVTREFKEGDEKATAAKGDGALYADQIKVPLAPLSASVAHHSRPSCGRCTLALHTRMYAILAPQYKTQSSH